MENLIKIKDFIIRYLSNFVYIIVYVIPSYLIFHNAYIYSEHCESTGLKIFTCFISVLGYIAILSLILYGIILEDIEDVFIFNAKHLKTKRGNYYYVCENYKVTFYEKRLFGYYIYTHENIKSYDSISIKNAIDVFYKELEKDCVKIEKINKEKKLKKLALEELQNYGKSN